MADYSENTKQNIGDLVLQIHDLENRLAGIRSRGDSLVIPLRAIADFFDSRLQEKIELVLAKEDYFVTTHLPRKQREQVLIEGKKHPAFSYPDDLKEIVQETFATEQALRQLKNALQHAKQRAHKV